MPRRKLLHRVPQKSTRQQRVLFVEQDTGIEPASVAWEATILPMN